MVDIGKRLLPPDGGPLGANRGSECPVKCRHQCQLFSGPFRAQFRHREMIPVSRLGLQVCNAGIEPGHPRFLAGVRILIEMPGRFLVGDQDFAVKVRACTVEKMVELLLPWRSGLEALLQEQTDLADHCHVLGRILQIQEPRVRKSMNENRRDTD